MIDSLVTDSLSTDSTPIESAIRAELPVDECAVRLRYTHDGAPHIIAYIRTRGPWTPDVFASRLKLRLPESLIPAAWVRIARMPLTSDGIPDEEALQKLPVVDAAVLRDCEERVNAQIWPSRARVAMQDHVVQPKPLHLSRLLPGWKADSTLNDELRTGGGEGVPLADPGRMAFSDGGPLSIPESPATLTEAFLRTAARQPARGLTYVMAKGNETFETYAEILVRAKRILTGLRAQGLKPGDAAILQIPNLPDHFAAFWACILGGIHPAIVAVPPSFDKSNPVMMKLHNTWELLRRPPVLTSVSIQASLREFGVHAVEDLLRHAEAQEIHPANPGDVVFYQLTSGSTGAPKCIQETHRGVLHHIHGSAAFVDYGRDDVILNWLPLDHVVPTLTVHLKDACLGCSEVQVKTDAVIGDPIFWLELMDRYRVTHTWAPNFGFKIVAEALAASGSKRFDLSCVKRFMNAGEQVTLPVVEDFLNAVRPFGVAPVAMQPAFGMAEACTCMTYQNDFSVESGTHWILKSSVGGTLMKGEARGRDSMSFIDLGPPIPGVQIRIADRENRLVPEGVIGRFQIKGAVITPGYLHNAKANEEAFVGDGWFDSGDLGFILNGRLTLTGRAKEMIIIRGANFYCYEIEDVVNRVDSVEPTYSAACAVDDVSGSEGLAVFYVVRSTADLTRAATARAIRSRVASDIGVTPAFLVPVSKEEFPKTTSGKIQRGQLKRLLGEGHYAERLAELDIELENANTLPDWFFRTVWRRREILRSELTHAAGPVLLLCDGSAVSDELRRTLENEGRSVITVQRGSEFRRATALRYFIDPASPGDYRLLMESLLHDELEPNAIVHLWSASGEPDPDFQVSEPVMESAVYSLLNLVQALAQELRGGAPKRLLVAATQAQAVRPDDPVAAEKAMGAGLVRTIAQEFPAFLCRHIDLESAGAEGARQIAQELRSADTEEEIAYRAGSRLIPRLERAHADTQSLRSIPFRSGGLYVISGGAGGIGIEIAAWLVKTFGARVLAMGRRAKSDAPVPHFLKMRPDCFRYETVDVASASSVSKAVEETMREWGVEKPAGVFHLAAEYHERALADETRESLASAFRAKLQGTAALSSLSLEEGGIFVHFSSVTHLFGGATIGAYSASNRFLDAFSHRQRSEAGIKSYCFDWSTWDEVGLSKDYPAVETLRARGYEAISVRRGLQSLLAGLSRAPGNLIIGLDDRRPFLRQFSESQPVLYSAPAALVESAAPGKLPLSCEASDAFVNRVVCEVRPASAGGAKSSAALSNVERRIVTLWKEVLQIDTLDVNDNFFELGGNSLLLVSMAARIQDEFGKKTGAVEMFRHPTVAKLADYIETSDKAPEEAVMETVQARAASRNSRMKARRETRVGRD
jgi:acyl-CoA synthetase (AMP-forming)/AMP-acid ligase II/NADP-dependent 3-hydroxy acid dehydrogenase YdfG/acyl carrier protein